VIKNADTSDDMQQDAIDCTTSALKSSAPPANVCARIATRASTHARSQAHNPKISERKALIKNADMSDDKQQDTIDCATSALKSRAPPANTRARIDTRVARRPQTLTICTCNINSLRYKCDKLLNELLLPNNIDICLLQKTKLDTTTPSPSIPGYVLVRRDRTANGGGVGIVIRDTIKHMAMGMTTHLEEQLQHECRWTVDVLSSPSQCTDPHRRTTAPGSLHSRQNNSSRICTSTFQASTLRVIFSSVAT
jgi:hypothetical protein